MIVYRVAILVKTECVSAFAAATIANHEATRKEPGNIRFDVLRSADNPAQFMLYEVYDSESAVAAHKETAHYKVWRDTVADMMEKPREGVKFEIIRPLERENW